VIELNPEGEAEAGENLASAVLAAIDRPETFSNRAAHRAQPWKSKIDPVILRDFTD